MFAIRSLEKGRWDTGFWSPELRESTIQSQPLLKHCCTTARFLYSSEHLGFIERGERERGREQRTKIEQRPPRSSALTSTAIIRTMPDYDFRVLSPIDFETLVRDLLQKELHLTLESFKSGADNGIDLRHISVRRNKLVIQCKHYVDSTFAALLRGLENHELEKVKKLKPERYILATSMPLTPERKDKIAGLFQPFIKTLSDIYGREDLNNLLGRFPEIEKQTFKLWFSSATILEEMLSTRINNVSRETLSKIQRDAKVYVENGSFGEALSILERDNFCLIVGVPGIGKTMLAEMLLLHYYSLGYDLIKIESDISEASEVDYVRKGRVFYYDDFLGQTSASDKFNKNEDQKLLDFIVAIKRSGVSKLILTTREYILNQARLAYERIDRTRFEPETCIVDLSKYTRLNRAKILYNHLYFSDLPAKHKSNLLKNKSYLRIIDHSNYSPRIVEYMTDYSRVAGVTGNNYANYFVATLDNPEDLWRHAFLSQIAQHSRDLLIVLLSLPREVFLEDLEEAFQSYRKQCVKALGVEINQGDFRRALRELDGSLVATSKSKDRVVVEFQNPSIRDFLENYLGSSLEELKLLVKAAVCFEQLNWLWEHKDRKNNNTFRSRIVESLSVDYLRGLRLSFVMPSFHLTNFAGPNSGTYKGRSEVSFEARARLIASVVAKISNPTSAAIWTGTLKYLTERVECKTVTRDDLVLLLKIIDKKKLATPEQAQSILAKSKELLTDIDWLDEYRPLVQFMEAFPQSFSREEKRASAEGFPAIARKNILDELVDDDPDTLRSYASEIEDIAKDLGVDVTVLLDDIESRAQSREEDADRPAESPHDYPQSTDEWCSDDEIESIFKGF